MAPKYGWITLTLFEVCNMNKFSDCFTWPHTYTCAHSKRNHLLIRGHSRFTESLFTSLFLMFIFGALPLNKSVCVKSMVCRSYAFNCRKMWTGQKLWRTINATRTTPRTYNISIDRCNAYLFSHYHWITVTLQWTQPQFHRQTTISQMSFRKEIGHSQTNKHRVSIISITMFSH